MCRILVVDDEADVLLLAREMLESEGYEVHTVESGEDAIELLPELDPDLVLLDVVMPGVSGLEVCRVIKRNEAMSGVKVVLFTALGAEVDMMLDEGDKADDYILKPFTRKTFLEKIEKHLH
ncbi:MAG: response regulator [archaeon]